MTDTERLNAWVERVLHVDQLTRTLSEELASLAAVPSGASPDVMAATLLALWQGLGFGDPGRSQPHRDAAQAMASRLENALGSGPTAFQRLAVNLDSALASTLTHGAAHKELVRTADFGDALVRHEVDDGAGCTRIVFLGPLNGLPSGHTLRSALPPDDYYKVAMGEPAVVLGASLSGGTIHTARPRLWYFKASVLSLTRGWRLSQRQREQEVVDREALEKIERDRAWRESPAGREANLKARLQELEARLAATGAGGF
jgi:hypothetical protein